MPDKPVMEPVVVPAGKCDGCPWNNDDRCVHPRRPAKNYTGCGRLDPCPLGTQDAVRWTPEVVGEGERVRLPLLSGRVVATLEAPAMADLLDVEVWTRHHHFTLKRCSDGSYNVTAWPRVLRFKMGAAVPATPDPDPTVEVPRDGLLRRKP